MDLISVIVPVYKVEQYLHRCVDSILAQTYTNLEVILVDDGSPDDCGRICDDYAAKDSRVQVVHKVNGGLSSARNAGLAVATGRYVGFVDSDDYIHAQMYEKLHRVLVENDAQISVCSYVYVDEVTGQADGGMAAVNPLKNGVLSTRQAYEAINSYRPGYSFYVTAWNKLYERTVFDGCLFAEGRLHEDEFIVHHLMKRCRRIAVTEDVLYYYVQRSGSIMNTKASEKSLDALIAGMDRYAFYLEEKQGKLAKQQLRATGWKAGDLLSKLDASVEKGKIAAAVKPVMLAMLKGAEPRVIKLLWAWVRSNRNKEKI